MTTGTKVFLAVFAAFVGVLVVYYGVLLPEAQTLPAMSPATRDLAGSNTNPQHDDMTAAAGRGSTPSPSTISEATPWSSGGGFSFALPVPADEPPAPMHAATDPLAQQTPPAVAESHAATTPEPVTEPATVASAPVANQPVALTGASPKPSATSQNRPGQLQPPPTTEYIVKSGDTMSSIAAEWFGDANKWSQIARENPLVDPAKLSVGQKLRLPPKDAKPASVKEQTRSSPTQSDYTVRSGDTLSKIAREYYGDVSKWKLIYDANKGVIGSDPAALKPGMKLKMPPK